MNKLKLYFCPLKITTMIIVKSREEIELMRESAWLYPKH
jgi:hypothetical protein